MNCNAMSFIPQLLSRDGNTSNGLTPELGQRLHVAVVEHSPDGGSHSTTTALRIDVRAYSSSAFADKCADQRPLSSVVQTKLTARCRFVCTGVPAPRDLNVEVRLPVRFVLPGYTMFSPSKRRTNAPSQRTIWKLLETSGARMSVSPLGDVLYTCRS
jgi:hypothetical protein